MSASDSYEILLERLEYPGSSRLRLVLEHLLTPEAARIVAALPGTPGEVAEKTGFDVDQVRQTLDQLFFKGVVFPRGDFNRREYYRFARNIVQIHDASQSSSGVDLNRDRKFFKLWEDFVRNEMHPRRAKEMQVRGAAEWRVVPAYGAIKDLPGVLPNEDYRELLKAQSHIAVVRCPCRLRATAIDKHCERTSEEETWHCIQFSRGADYSTARGAGKDLSVEEALALMEKVEDDGLVHTWPNVSAMTGVNTTCNCCRDCCINYQPLDAADLPIGLIWEKSRFTAYLADGDLCNGCQNCVDRCQFDAIEMVKVAGSRRLKALVDEEKCYGCGLCVLKCDPGVLKMKIVRPPEHIPVTG